MPYKYRFIYAFSAVICWTLMVTVSDAEIRHQEDTMLMFVGENLDVLTIASRREESAWQAPAVAQVITRKALRDRGADTLSKALETVPGFYMARKEWGTQPFLRGIPDSVLLLYDTVPMTSDVSKSLHPFDREMSMAGVKRIEIIKGPGSVLWGPDAFAGIVNVVPMTGKDLDGAETGLIYGAPDDRRGFYVNAGHDTGRWDAFLSVSGYEGEQEDTGCDIVRFWPEDGDPVSPEDRFGWERPGMSRYFEAFGRVAYEDWLTISGRFADNRRAYAMTSSTENLTWCETRDNPLAFVKVDAKKQLDYFSVLRMSGSFTRMASEHEIIDRTLQTQKEITGYGEIVYDRSLFSGTGLFTGGISYREKHIRNAPIWAGYLPGYLEADNTDFLPLDEIEDNNYADYNARLWSFFGQYSHKIGDADLWLGLRHDSHDAYEDHLSFNTGIAWSPVSRWIFKILYGTAYRTPFARQLRNDDDLELEKIKSLNLQTIWKPSEKWRFDLCGFWNRIENHVMEDPYAGLSLPNHQEITGVEFEARYSPLRSLDLSANLTLMSHSGPEERYRSLLYVIPEPVYEDRFYPYDGGAETLFNLTASWRPAERISAYCRLGYTGSRRLIHPRGDEFLTSPGVWLLDMNTIFQDVGLPGLNLELSVRNVADRRYETPGTYSSIEGEPVTAQIILRKKW